MPEPIADLFQIKLLLGALETTWKGHLAIKGAKKDQRGKLSHFFSCGVSTLQIHQ